MLRRVRFSTDIWFAYLVNLNTIFTTGNTYQLASSDKPLPEILAEQSFNTRRISDQYTQRFKEAEQLQEVTAGVVTPDSDLPPRLYPGEAKRKRAEMTSVHETEETLSQMSPIEIGTPDQLNATAVPRVDVPAITQWNKDTTYLVCNDIQQLTPLVTPESSNEQQPATVEAGGEVKPQANESYVAFYIPPEPSSRSSSDSVSHFMELKCKIVAVEMVPLIRKMGRLGTSPSLPMVNVSA